MNELSSGKSISEIVESLSISLDQAKKISRLFSMQKQIVELPQDLQNKFKALGLKALVLAPILKSNDIEGLQDILQSIDTDIKRDTLAKMITALNEKRKHIEESKDQIREHMRVLEHKQEVINDKIHELHVVEVQLGKIFDFLKPATNEARDFLMEHLGVKNEKIVLAKRLYYTWQQELKRDAVIEYDYSSYSWDVKDINKLIVATEKKLSNKRSRQCMYFNPDTDPWNSSAEYKKVTGVDTNLKNLFDDNQKEIKKLDKERKSLVKSIDDIKSKSAMSYMEAVILSNELSSKDIETHSLLQDQGMKWLFNQDYVCATELSMGSYRFDVIGYDKDDIITIIEAKASKEDFQRDIKWQNYLKYSNKFYFIFHEYEWYEIKRTALTHVQEAGAGILIVKGNNRIELLQECQYRDVVSDKKSLIFSTARTCSKKMIYGY